MPRSGRQAREPPQTPANSSFLIASVSLRNNALHIARSDAERASYLADADALLG